MNKTSAAVLIAALLSAVLSANVWAEDNSMSNESAQGSNAMNQSAPQSNAAEINPSEYTGKEVIDAKGDSIGKIEKLVTHNSDHAVYAVVGVGGFMGIGEKETAIPIDNLQSHGEKWQLSIGITKDLLQQRMKYEESEFSAFEATDEPSGD